MLENDSNGRVSPGTQSSCFPGNCVSSFDNLVRAAEVLSSWKNCSALGLRSFTVACQGVTEALLEGEVLTLQGPGFELVLHGKLPLLRVPLVNDCTKVSSGV